jgi:AcrR family transcriptional regulator
MPKHKVTREPPRELKEACVQAAREVIAERGVEHLSLREVSRKLGVSHQAPYKHYRNRDHLLAEVMRRSFLSFAAALGDHASSDDPVRELGDMGRQFLAYASNHPLEYRLMFSTPWPAPEEHPELVRDARYAFDRLRSGLRRIFGEAEPEPGLVDLHAIFIWSAMHGVATIMRSDVMRGLNLPAPVRAQAEPHVMAMVAKALTAPDPSPGGAGSRPATSR